MNYSKIKSWSYLWEEDISKVDIYSDEFGEGVYHEGLPILIEVPEVNEQLCAALKNKGVKVKNYETHFEKDWPITENLSGNHNQPSQPMWLAELAHG